MNRKAVTKQERIRRRNRSTSPAVNPVVEMQIKFSFFEIRFDNTLSTKVVSLSPVSGRVKAMSPGATT